MAGFLQLAAGSHSFVVRGAQLLAEKIGVCVLQLNVTGMFFAAAAAAAAAAADKGQGETRTKHLLAPGPARRHRATRFLRQGDAWLT